MQAEQVLRELEQRLRECGLRLHPDKTQRVYCKDGNRKRNYPVTQFDFLGYTFRRRSVRNAREQKNFVGFTPAVSVASKKAMNKYLRGRQIHRHVQADIRGIACSYNPVLRGCLEYYGRYGRSEMTTIFTNFNKRVVQWLMRKYKRFRGHKTRAGRYLESNRSRGSTPRFHEARRGIWVCKSSQIHSKSSKKGRKTPILSGRKTRNPP